MQIKKSVKELPKWFRTIYNYKVMPLSFLFHKRNVLFHATTWYWGNHKTYPDFSGAQERTEYGKLGISQYMNLIFFLTLWFHIWKKCDDAFEKITN